MIVEWINNILRFLVLVGLQVLILNRIDITPYTNAYIYVLFILMLPVNINRVMLLVVSMLIGLVIDIFSNTPGMHSTASLVIAFIRPGLLNILVPRENFDSTIKLSWIGMGSAKFMVYAAVIITLHHLILFSIESYLTLPFFSLLLRVIACSVCTLFLVVLSQFLMSNRKGLKA